MRNVVLLVLDALRYDHVTPEITPNLVKIGEDGVFYTEALAVNTATVKSMPGILSSGLTYDPAENLATAFKENGYTTAVFHSSPLVGRNFMAGFDISRDLHTQKGLRDRKIRRLARKFLPQGVFDAVKGTYRRLMDEDTFLPYLRAPEVLGEASEWMKTAEKPYFVWIHLMEPHLPYYPLDSGGLSREDMIKLNDKLVDAAHRRYKPTDDEVAILKDLYRRDVHEMDQAIGDFYSSVKDDVLVVTSDHGDEFGEYGDFSHWEDKFIPCLQHIPLIVAGSEERHVRKPGGSHLDISRLAFQIAGIDKKIGIWKGWKS